MSLTYLEYADGNRTRCAIVESDGAIDVRSWLRRAHGPAADGMVAIDVRCMDGMSQVQRDACIARHDQINDEQP